MFSQFGYRGTTIDQIAAKAGMSKANLLYYFRRKNDVYLAVLESILDQWLEPLARLDQDKDPEQELRAYIETKLRLSQQNPRASRLFANEIMQGAPMIQPFLSNQLKELVELKCEVIQHWIDNGKLQPVKPMHLIFMIWASTQHYADFATQIQALTTDTDDKLYKDASQTLSSIVLRGVLVD